MAIIDSFSPRANFWESHPQLLVPQAFKEFHEGDSSPNKEKSSKIMWAIGLVYDYESEYATQVIEDRIKLIEDDFLEMPGFFTKYEGKLIPLIETYNHIQRDAPRRLLAEWDEGMDRRTQFLKETPYTIDGGSKLDKIWAETKKLFDMRDKLKQEYLTKKAVTNTKGDYSPSMLESGKV